MHDNVRTGDVGGRNDREFIPGDAVVVPDGFDETARSRTANRYAVEHARKEDIVNVTRLSRDLGAAFLPDHRSTDGHPGILVPRTHRVRDWLIAGRIPRDNPA